MPMTPFYTRFPDVAARETRTAFVLQGGGLPPGEYGFVECYCDEEGCDCRRTLIQVISPPRLDEVLAVINFGWESIDYYAGRLGGDQEAGREITSASLDPLNPQSKLAPELLDLFRREVLRDPAYVARLAAHYALFKGIQPKEPASQEDSSPRISYAALNSTAERKAADDAKYRRQLQKNGKTLLSQARQSTDAELLAKLSRFGLQLDRDVFREQCRRALSAEELARQVPTPKASGRAEMEIDWLWYGFLILWERWFPDLPNLEQLDDLMQHGYTLSERGQDESPAACDAWLKAWDLFLALCAKGGFTSLPAFDEAFRGTQFVSNWVQDLEHTLFAAGHRDPRYHEHRVRYCQEFLDRFGAGDDLIRENMRRAVAESWSELGQRDRSDALFAQWLQADPQWGWGWIGWADTYFFAAKPRQDVGRAESLLKQALDVKNVRDRDDILERLASVYEDQGRAGEAAAILRDLQAARTAVNPVAAPARLDPGPFEPVASPPPRKIGRNDPCPCGSGRKYKKCCGKNP